ncbi:protease, insulinase family/protease, insulinase family [Chondromyces apiculatus DSM 436]|uniref:Protease, insulinase family/protease, insulinase family n=1 Tax=Chondromyces apiculatus DSM 436 TaxID=1192034 RepID=A0A017TH44_9BACT|nr:protease, insulinase family/protease, insulinase family [Chondromyces apiculatus DSM 436]
MAQPATAAQPASATTPASAAKPAPAPAPAAKPAPAAAAAAPAAAQAAPPAKPIEVSLPFEKYVLANGLEVILHEDHRTPLVAVNVWYHVGSKDEARGRNGFAHLFEHVMFQGSKNVGEDQFFKYLERAGASERNGTTNSDRTNYFETVPTNQLALVLWLESDRMGTLLDHADEETFKSQRDVVKNERRQNYENAPYGLLPQFIDAALYPETHPYHLLTIGTPQDLDAATMEDVRGFFRTYYVPGNATLSISGDIDKAKTKQLVEKYFSTLKGGPKPAVKATPDAGDLATEKRLAVEADVELPRVQVSWVTPAFFAKGDAELDLVAQVLATGKSSRLYKRLVHDLQIAQEVNAWQASSQLASDFNVSVTLKKGESPEKALQIVDEELARLRKEAPTEDEVTRARARTLSGMVFRMESVTARADSFNMYNHYTGDPGFFSKDLARYEKVTPADLQQAAATMLPVNRRVVAVVTPTKGAPRAGRLVTAPAATATSSGK